MDIKVLTAVFITLFGLAVGMAQGDVQVDDPEEAQGILDRLLSSISLDSLLSLGSGGIGLPGGDGGGSDGPAPNTTLEASFTGEIQPFTVRDTGRVDTLELHGSDASMNVSDFSVGTDEFAVTLTNFSGQFVYNDTVRLAGTAAVIEFSEVPLSATEDTEVALQMDDLEYMEYDQTDRLSFNVEDIDGNFSTGGQQRDIAAAQANVTSFTGSMAVNATSGITELDGSVYEAVFSGDGFTTVLGGE